MKTKALTLTLRLALFLLVLPQVALAQKHGEAQSVSFGDGNRTTLRFANNDPKQRHCGAFITHTLMDDNREAAIAIRVTHLHVAGLYFRPSLHEEGWLYITPSRIVFSVEEGDRTHAFDIPRTVLKDKPYNELYAGYQGIQLNLNEKLPGSDSSAQKFVFSIIYDKRCRQMEASPYRHFIQRAVKDFNAASAEFQRIADSLKQAGKVQPTPAAILPPGGSTPAGSAAPSPN